MLNSWDKLDDESKKKFLKIIEEQSNRLINLVENMLSVTKLQSEKDDLIFREVEIKPVADTVVSIVKNQYPDKKFDVSINEKMGKVLADSDKFHQIMTNLTENAAKYSNPNTTIYIKTEPCSNSDFVQISVTDTGVEISPQDYEKIFTKFSRIDNPLTRKIQGSGLGLFITKNLVEKMGGQITVNSDNGVTTFKILLPCANIEKQARVKCNQ